jgi:broad specificity phosphatase PhoE
VTTLYLARHGESDWNVERRWQGNADRPLTDLGRRQAGQLAERLASTPLDAVYSSDLRRARETAEAVARRQGLEVRTLAALREVDVGSWSGLTREEVEERFPAAFATWREGGHGWEGGEAYEDMAERVVTAVLEIAGSHPGGSVLVVAHGGPIRALHSVALGLDISEHRRLKPVAVNAHLSRLHVENGRLTVER